MLVHRCLKKELYRRFCMFCRLDFFDWSSTGVSYPSCFLCYTAGLLTPDGSSCNEPPLTQVRSILSDDWFALYENLTLKRGLSLMRDVATCPRPGCETVVILDDETLGRCPRCELAFCPFCLKTYHGTIRCSAMPKRKQDDGPSPEELERLRKEEEATGKFLEDKTRPCPGCSAPCMKISGCNKMVCCYCGTYFCWLCGVLIYNRANPYEHFREGSCANRLFEGVAPMLL